MTHEQLAILLTAQRKQMHIKQREVAEHMHKHISFVQALEYKPGTNRKIQTYLDYADAIGVKIEFVITPKA